MKEPPLETRCDTMPGVYVLVPKPSQRWRRRGRTSIPERILWAVPGDCPFCRLYKQEIPSEFFWFTSAPARAMVFLGYRFGYRFGRSERDLRRKNQRASIEAPLESTRRGIPLSPPCSLQIRERFSDSLQNGPIPGVFQSVHAQQVGTGVCWTPQLGAVFSTA